MTAIERVTDASGSAIKGVKMAAIERLPSDRIDGSLVSELYLVSAGYDQRVNIWTIQRSPDLPASELNGGISSSKGIMAVNSVNRSTARFLKWFTGIVTYISDVNSLDVAIHPSSLSNATILDVLVVGEGFEVLKVPLK